jgi:hypothetical protein
LKAHNGRQLFWDRQYFNQPVGLELFRKAKHWINFKFQIQKVWKVINVKRQISKVQNFEKKQVSECLVVVLTGSRTQIPTRAMMNQKII